MIDVRDISHIALDVRDVESTIRRSLAPCGFVPLYEVDDHVVLTQNAITLLVRRADGRGPDPGFGDDDVRDVAFSVPDVARAFDETVRRGATVVEEPATWVIGDRRLTRATVGGPGRVVHSLVDGDVAPRQPSRGSLGAVDHVAMCLAAGTLEETADYYRRVFDFYVSHEEYVETKSSGMRSMVVESPNHRVRFPLQEPSPRHPRGQIEDYLANHGGPGVQHVAFLTDDMLRTTASMRQGGIEFLDAPRGYYDRIQWGAIDERQADLRAANVLVDWEASGYLLQIFTRSSQPRKTLFFEVIQRRNARGFGSANIKALFEALEHP